MRAATARVLERAGFDVAVAAGGDDALTQVADGLRPEIIVSDVVMPGLRGPALAAHLRERLGSVPVLFVSGYAERAFEGGMAACTDHLAKPYASRELIARLCRLLDDPSGGLDDPGRV